MHFWLSLRKERSVARRLSLAYRLSICIVSFYDNDGEPVMSRTSTRPRRGRPVIQSSRSEHPLRLIVALLLAPVFHGGWPQRPLGIELVTNLPAGAARTPGDHRPRTGRRGHHSHNPARLLAIVDTVRSGDPFILDNARRLHAIAWSVLAIEVLRL
jgi:hypothetical protein